MKFRKIAILIICIVLVVVSLYLLFPGKTYKLNEAYGPFYGKDHVAYVGDGMYEIVHFNGKDHLFSRYAGRLFLMDSIGYTSKDGVLYFGAEEGYAVIYPENNLCKLYILPEEYGEIRIVVSEEYPLNELVVYLDSFEEYTEYEQKMLNKLIEKYENRQRRKEMFNSFFGSVKD